MRGTSRRAGWRSSSSSTRMDPFLLLLMAGIPPGEPGRLALKLVQGGQGREVKLTIRL